MASKVVCVLLVYVCLVRTQVIPGKSRTNDGDYNTVNTDGSFDFGYTNKDAGSSYHLAHGNANKVVGGRFGARDPATGTVKETVYTAGPRGFRAKGPNIHRKMDLDQRPRGPIGNKDDPYFDPNEDPSYDFKFNTRTYSKNENADSRGDVKGHYSYVDDIGERHDVTYIAGRDTGFHVSSAHPDSPNTIGSPFHRAPLVRGETKQRGKTAVQRGLDGSYRFISAGPDQRRTESSDANGNVRGSYTFLDDKGVQRTVHYIAGPGIGYRIVKNGKDPYIPSYFPTIPSAYDPDFVNAAVPASFSPDDTGSDDVFKSPDGTAASGHVKPPPFSNGDKERPNKKPGSSSSSEENETGYGQGPSYPGNKGSGEDANFSPDGSYVPDDSFPPSGSYTPDGSFAPDEDASSFSGGEYDAKPTKAPGRRPIRPGRPTAKPYGTTKKPYVPLKPFQIPSSDEIGEGYPRPSAGASSPSSSSGGSQRPSSRPGGSFIKPSSSGGNVLRPGSGGNSQRPPSSGGNVLRPGSGGNSQRPSSSSGNVLRPGSGGNSQRPSSSSGNVLRPGSGGNSQRPSSSGVNVLRPGTGGNSQRPSSSGGGNFPLLPPSDLGGPFQKPSSGSLGGDFHKPASSVPGGSSYEEVVPPSYDTGSSSFNSGSSSYEDKSSESGPEFAIGFNIQHSDDHTHSKPPGTTIIHTKPGTTIIHKPGTTIIRNIGEDYFGIPPGTSVRAHVQSIDLYPYNSKPISPSEALEKDKT